MLLNELKKAEKYKNEEFDYLKNTKIALTHNNAYKVETLLKIDSNYRNTQNLNNKPDSYFVEYLKKDLNLIPSSKIKEKGSSTYWINELTKLINNDKNVCYNIDIILKGIICTIDIENSTHLSSRNDIKSLTKDEIKKSKGRQRVFERLKNNYFTEKDRKDGYKRFLNSINNPNNDQYRIIEIIAKPDCIAEKNHFSFATKFCRYVCLGLNTKRSDDGTIIEINDKGDNYYIYDSVIMDNLKDYVEEYIGIDNITDIEKQVLKDRYFYTQINDGNEIDYGKHYRIYFDLLDKVRNSSKDKISRNAFDHIIWYFNK